MKTMFYSIFMLLLLASSVVLTGCSDEKLPVVEPAGSGVVKDANGNDLHWIRIGSLDWTTDNASDGTAFYNVVINPAQSYSNKVANINSVEEGDAIIAEYGNYYTFADAVKSAPEGWRVPTDQDWKSLERQLGMSEGDLDAEDLRGEHEADVLRSAALGFNLVMGGNVIRKPMPGNAGNWVYARESGYYWTSTLDESKTDYEAAYCRKFLYNSGKIGRYSVSTLMRMMSVRYVRDAQ